jgi:chromate transporter
VPALLVALLTLIAVAALRWPLVWVIGGLGALSVALAWWRLES